MGGDFRVVCFQTSDELALSLVQSANDWQLRPLTWETPTDVASLLDMRVVGAEPSFDEGLRVKSKNLADKAFEMPDVFGCGNPYEHGAESADAANEGDDHEEGDPYAFGADDENEEAMSSSSLEAEAAELASGLGGPEGGDDDDDDDEMDVFDSAVADEPTIADFVEASDVNDVGYVTCPLEPWASKARVGRISTWPFNKPLENRSVAMRCYVHPNCTVAKARWRVTDQQLLKWLFSGTIPESGCTAARRAELQKQHVALFPGILADVPAP